MKPLRCCLIVLCKPEVLANKYGEFYALIDTNVIKRTIDDKIEELMFVNAWCKDSIDHLTEEFSLLEEISPDFKKMNELIVKMNHLRELWSLNADNIKHLKQAKACGYTMYEISDKRIEEIDMNEYKDCLNLILLEETI